MKWWDDLKCRLGLHKWSKTQKQFHFDSNVIDNQAYCLNCGKAKKWNTPVREETKNLDFR